MRPATNLEIASLCFAHQYRRVGWDLTHSMSSPRELGDGLDGVPDRAYPEKLWGESVVHAFKALRERADIPSEDVDELAAWQLAEPDRAPIRLLAPESIEVFQAVYPEQSAATAALRALQTCPPALPAELDRRPEGLLEYVERHASLLWSAQQSFAILFFNFLLHHGVLDPADVA